MKAFEGNVAAAQLLASIPPPVSCSKGISQSPEQFPEGQSVALKAEHFPAQLAPSPQEASLTVLFGWQQVMVTDSLRKVKTFSKKSIEVTFVFPEVGIM